MKTFNLWCPACHETSVTYKIGDPKKPKCVTVKCMNPACRTIHYYTALRSKQLAEKERMKRCAEK